MEDEEEFIHKPVVIIPRAEWKADPPQHTVPMIHPIKKVVFTFSTNMDRCMTREECILAMQILQGRHKDEGSDDIKYNFVIGGDGTAYEGRGYFNQPCKSLALPEHHGERMDIAFIGRFPNNEKLPSKLKLAAYDVAQRGIEMGYVEKWYSYWEILPKLSEQPL